MVLSIKAGCIVPPKSFYHSGDLGDIIYSLPTVRGLGGGTLYLGPDGYKPMMPREPMTLERFTALAPLLRAQEYIADCQYRDKSAGVSYNLNGFKEEMLDGKWLDSKPGFNLARIHLKHFGLPLELDAEPWLTVENPATVPPVIISRSARYHAKVFDWRTILTQYRGLLAFVGLPAEHAAFCKQFGAVPYLETLDLLHLAQVIAGASLFVGNQSCPFAIAMGLGKRSILEMSPQSANTIFNRPSLTLGCGPGTVLPKLAPPVARASVSTQSQILPLTGHFDTGSGYGTYSCQLALELIARGYDVQIRSPTCHDGFSPVPKAIKQRLTSQPINHPWEFLIYPAVIQPKNISLGNHRIAYLTMWETTRLESVSNRECQGAIQRLNKCQLVMVPNAWNASVFSSCGIDAPLRITPLGTDTSLFKAFPNRVDSGPLVFGTAAKTASGGIRKGFEIVLQAFQKAFPKEQDVRLKVKAFEDDPKLYAQNDPRIEFTYRYLPVEQLVNWYQSINLFASGSASEGWGRHQQEAMCCGRPVIGINFGGVCEFFNEENGFPVDWTLKPAQGVYQSMGHYAVPSVDSMAEQMRLAYERRDLIQQKSRLGIQSAQRFTITHSVDTIIKALQEFKMLT